MARSASGKPKERASKLAATGPAGAGGSKRTRDAATGRVTVAKMRFEAIMEAADRSGLLRGKSGRIAGRVSPALVRQAKQQTGIDTDTDLIEFALASVALEDDFSEVFRKSRGKVDPDLKLGF
jgi:hypothetical protein